MSKKLEIKQRRREEAERREAERKAAARRRNIVTSVIGLLVVAAVAVVVIFSRDSAESIGGSIAEAGCEDIETFDAAGSADARGHVEDGSPVEYETQPPTYGSHYGTTAPAGFAEEAVPEGAYVHNLEHGQIVIHYSPDASEDTKDKIDTLVQQEPQATLAVPTEGLDKPVYFTAWGAMQGCDEPAQAAADAFRERFQGRGPEQVGIPTFDG
jgi:Protein of unknown function (DUF3105)